MISLSDSQLSVVMNYAEPLPPADRDKFLHRVASLLHGVEIGDGTVSRAARQAQSEIFKAPILPGNAGVPRHTTKLQRRATTAA